MTLGSGKELTSIRWDFLSASVGCEDYTRHESAYCFKNRLTIKQNQCGK